MQGRVLDVPWLNSLNTAEGLYPGSGKIQTDEVVLRFRAEVMGTDISMSIKVFEVLDSSSPESKTTSYLFY